MEKLLIGSLEQACQERGYNVEDVTLDLSKFPEKHRKAVQAFASLCVITEAQNQGNTLDYNHTDQEKYFPVFDLEKHEEVNPSGFRFYCSGYHCLVASLAGGSRLCVQDREDADHLGKAFAPLYKDILVIEV